MEQAERELVSRAQAGDGAAFGELVERYLQAVYRVVYRLLLDQADAEDVVQETFLRAYRYLPRYQPEREFRHWLYAIAVNECHRFRSRWRRMELVPLEETFPDPTWQSSPERTALYHELTGEVRKAMQKLSAQQRAALVLMEVEGLSSTEAGEVLGCSATTARAHLFRAKQRLRRELRAYLEPEPAEGKWTMSLGEAERG